MVPDGPKYIPGGCILLLTSPTLGFSLLVLFSFIPFFVEAFAAGCGEVHSFKPRSFLLFLFYTPPKVCVGPKVAMKGWSEYFEDAYMKWLSTTMTCCGALEESPVRGKSKTF
jgi:hypothetical protein